MKDSFILYTDQKEIIDNLSDEQAGQLLKAIYNYVQTEEDVKLDGILKIAFIPIKQSLDRNQERWEEIKKKRSMAGKIGAEIKKQKKAKQANVNFEQANANKTKQKETKQAVNVSVSVPVPVNVNNNIFSSSSSSSNNNNIAKIDELMIECLNTTNTNNIKECITYLDKIPIELIEYGLRKTARTKSPSWKYAMTILDDYVRKKFTSLDQVKADELNFKALVNNKNGPIEETEEEKIARKTRELEEAIKNANK